MHKLISDTYIYEKNQDSVGLRYLKCAARQDFADANYKLATYYEGIDVNLPVALHYYQRAALLGEKKAALTLQNIFRDGKLGYNKNESLANFYSGIYDTLSKNADARFPNLAKDHPLPPHPIQGYHADKDIDWQPSGNEDDY